MKYVWLALFAVLVMASGSCAERKIVEYGPYPTRGQARVESATEPDEATAEAAPEEEAPAAAEETTAQSEAEPAEEPAAEPAAEQSAEPETEPAEETPAEDKPAETETTAEAAPPSSAEAPQVGYQECDAAGGDCTVVATFRDLETCRRFQAFQSVSCTCKSSAKDDCWTHIVPDTEIVCRACAPGDDGCKTRAAVDRCGAE